LSYESYQKYLSVVSSPANYFIDSKKELIDDQFEYSSSYENVTIKHPSESEYESIGIRIVDENSINKNPYKKCILSKIDKPIHVGSIINWDSVYWLCTSVEANHNIYYKGNIEKCNNTLNFMVSATPCSSPCIILDKSSLNSSGREAKDYFFLQEGQIMVIVTDNTDTNTLDLDDRFVFNGKYSYKLNKINELTQSQSGLLYLTMEITQRSSEDDLENNLPDDEVPEFADDSYI
jgi:hypothetical protein